jgi:hypothetical protein
LHDLDIESLEAYIKLKKETEEEVESYKNEINTIFETKTLDPEWVRLFERISTTQTYSAEEVRNCLFTLLRVNRCSRTLLTKKCLDLEEQLSQISSVRRTEELYQEHLNKITAQDKELMNRNKELEAHLRINQPHYNPARFALQYDPITRKVGPRFNVNEL